MMRDENAELRRKLDDAVPDRHKGSASQAIPTPATAPAPSGTTEELLGKIALHKEQVKQARQLQLEQHLAWCELREENASLRRLA